MEFSQWNNLCQLSTDTNLLSTLILDSQSLQLWENNFFKPPSVWCFVMAALQNKYMALDLCFIRFFNQSNLHILTLINKMSVFVPFIIYYNVYKIQMCKIFQKVISSVQKTALSKTEANYQMRNKGLLLYNHSWRNSSPLQTREVRSEYNVVESWSQSCPCNSCILPIGIEL